MNDNFLEIWLLVLTRDKLPLAKLDLKGKRRGLYLLLLANCEHIRNRGGNEVLHGKHKTKLHIYGEIM